MTKLKNGLVLLLVFLLVVLGAVLPGAVARVQDELTAGQMQYADVDSLQLKLEERSQALSMQEKLALIPNGVGVEVNSEVTDMKGAQVLETLYTQLESYADLGLLTHDLDNDLLEFSPVMVYDEADSKRYSFYWRVTTSFDGAEYDSLNVILDDETGTILAMEYVNPNLYIEAESLWEYQEILRKIYFGNLGLEPVDAMALDTEGILGEAMESVMDSGDSYTVMRYQLIDVRYGEVNVEITVHSNGFIISLG